MSKRQEDTPVQQLEPQLRCRKVNVDHSPTDSPSSKTRRVEPEIGSVHELVGVLGAVKRFIANMQLPGTQLKRKLSSRVRLDIMDDTLPQQRRVVVEVSRPENSKSSSVFWPVAYALAGAFVTVLVILAIQRPSADTTVAVPVRSKSRGRALASASRSASMESLLAESVSRGMLSFQCTSDKCDKKRNDPKKSGPDDECEICWGFGFDVPEGRTAMRDAAINDINVKLKAKHAELVDSWIKNTLKSKAGRGGDLLDYMLLVGFEGVIRSMEHMLLLLAGPFSKKIRQLHNRPRSYRTVKDGERV